MHKRLFAAAIATVATVIPGYFIVNAEQATPPVRHGIEISALTNRLTDRQQEAASRERALASQERSLLNLAAQRQLHARYLKHVRHVHQVWAAKRAAARAERIRRARIAAAVERRKFHPVVITGGAGYTGIAVRIARCESGGNPRAQNATSTASGLYQFLDSTWTGTTGLAPPASAYSAATQTAAFWKLWNGGAGAGNWNPSRSCWS